MVNYLAVLGWGRPMAPRSGRSPRSSTCSGWKTSTRRGAFFDLKKLDHFNGEYIRALPTDEFVSRSTRWLFNDPPWPPERFDATVFESRAPLVQERVTNLAEAPGYVDFMFLPEPAIDDAACKGGQGSCRGPALLDAIIWVSDLRVGAQRPDGGDQGRRRAARTAQSPLSGGRDHACRRHGSGGGTAAR